MSPFVMADLRNADAPWLDCAWRALRQLAAEGRDFTANDLTELGVNPPDHPSRWGALFSAASREGVITHVGWRTSPRPSRNGGVCKVWRGTGTRAKQRAAFPCECNHGRALHAYRACMGSSCRCAQYAPQHRCG